LAPSLLVMTAPIKSGASFMPFTSDVAQAM